MVMDKFYYGVLFRLFFANNLSRAQFWNYCWQKIGSFIDDCIFEQMLFKWASRSTKEKKVTFEKKIQGQKKI